MNFKIKTQVAQDYKTVFNQFDESLFKALKPPLIGLKVKRFDGSQLNSEVHVELNILGVKKLWVSKITEFQQTDTECYFTDTSSGNNLPPPLKNWKHKHLIVKQGTGSMIVDDVTYTSGWKLLDGLLYPVLYFQFAWRKPVYRKYFK